MRENHTSGSMSGSGKPGQLQWANAEWLSYSTSIIRAHPRAMQQRREREALSPACQSLASPLVDGTRLRWDPACLS